MKKNRNNSDNWIKIKAIEYFRNFICDYQEPIENEEVFSAILKNLDRMTDPHPPDFFTLWNQGKTREKARNLLLHRLDYMLLMTPAENFENEAFPVRWRQLSKGYNFDAIQMEIFLVILLLNYRYLACDMGDGCEYGASRLMFISRCLKLDCNDVLLELAPFSELVMRKCVEPGDYTLGSKGHDAFDNLMLKAGLIPVIPYPPIRQTQKPKPKPKKRAPYLLDDVRVKGRFSLKQIMKALTRFRDCALSDEDCPRMSLLLSGPPGTGKTEFVKHVAEELGFTLVMKCVSDVLDSKVGETEKTLSKIFENASNNRTILFLDEFDGLLQSRAMATQTWEVSQVTEILQQMENFSGVFIAATNFEKNIDPAALRRFTFKVTFECLNDAGKEHFFETFFHAALSPEEKARLARIENLTPGDFRTVRQALFYLDDEFTNGDRLAALEEESLAKVNTCFGPRGNKIGF